MATKSLLHHYLEYISSPAVLLVILLIVGPLYLEAFSKWRLLPAQKTQIPGCFRLGLTKRSNLGDQYSPPKSRKQRPRTSIGEHTVTGNARVQALFTYPVKSCRGVELAASEVSSTGLKYDRIFTFAQMSDNGKADKPVDGSRPQRWRFITQREFPRLALITTELWVPDPRAGRGKPVDGLSQATMQGARARGVQKGFGSLLPNPLSPHHVVAERSVEDSWQANGGCLIVRFPYEHKFNPLGLLTETVTIKLPLAPTLLRAEEKAYASEPLSIWIDTVQAVNVSHEIPAKSLTKLRQFLGIEKPLALFRIDDGNKRAVTRSLPTDRPGKSYNVDFQDAFPLHILNLASIRAIDAELPGETPSKGSLDARRLRANIYITGPSAYAEDSWRKVTMGRCVKPRSQAVRDRSRGRSQTPEAGDEMVETDGEYHIACRCARCTLPNVDPETGVRDRNEPFTTLSRTRKVDKGAYPHPCLGMQVIPLFTQGILRVGDDIDVLERGEHIYEKMFP